MRMLAVLAFVALGSIAVGCGFRGDWWMHVRNDTDQQWIVRVRMLPDQPDRFMVALIEPGADGPAVQWRGGRDVMVEVLGLDCSSIGPLRPSVGDDFVVDAVPGLTGHVVPQDTPWGANRSEGIVDLSSCGGIPGAPYLMTPAP